MRKILAVAILAALAPLGIAQAAPSTPAPMATKMPMKGKMSKMPMKGKMSKMPMKGKMSMKSKKMMGSKKTMPMRDPKTGRFMKKPAATPMAAMPKK